LKVQESVRAPAERAEKGSEGGGRWVGVRERIHEKWLHAVRQDSAVITS